MLGIVLAVLVSLPAPQDAATLAELAHHFDRGQGANLDLLLVVRKRLVGQGHGTLLNFHILVGVDQIPVDILNLIHSRNDLKAKSYVRNLAVILCRNDETPVG